MTPKRSKVAGSRRCGLYVRISKDRANEVSTDVQREACAKYAKDRGWAVVEVFEDVGRSAFKANTKRPAFDEMVESVKEGSVDTVVAYKLDRLSRSVRDFSNLAQTLTENGAEFVSVTESFDTTTPMGRAMVSIASVFAELESAVKSERISDALAHRRARGSATNGPRPFGLSADRKKVVAREAKLIGEAARRVLSGGALNEILRDWNGRGIKTTRGNEWSSRGLVYVLTNPTTAGLRDVEGTLVAGTMPAALDRKTWERVAAVLSDPSRRKNNSNRLAHLLTGIVRCGRCGTPMAAKPHKAGWRYVCTVRKGHDACGGVSVDGAKVDGLVADSVVYRIDSDAVRKARTTPGGNGHDELALIEDDLEQVATDFGAGLLSRREWQAARAALESRKAEVAETRASGRESATFARLASAKNVGASWAALDFATQRTILTRTLVERMTVDGIDSDDVIARRTKRLKERPDSDQHITVEDRLDIKWKV